MPARRLRVPPLLVLLLLLAASAGVSSAAASPTVTLDGAPLPLPAALYRQDDALVPARPLAEALGATVTWDGRRREVVIRRGPRTVAMRIGQPWALVDGRRVDLNLPPILVGGRTLALLRFLGEALGATVRWDPSTLTFTLTTGGSSAAAAPATTAAPAAAQAQGAPPAAAPPGRRRYRVLGYAAVDYPGDRSWQQAVEQQSANLDLVVFFGLQLTADGHLVNPTGGDPGELLAAAARRGLPALLAVHNVASDGFDTAAVHALLRDPAARARAVENVYRAVRGRFAGVNLDLEGLDPADRSAYTDFVRQVADRFRPAGLLVTVAVPAKTVDVPWDGWNGAFDYAALGSLADLVVVMAYDEHWPGSPPGPVASLGWVGRVVRYALTAIPPERILLGIPAYGYDWPAWGAASGLTAPAAARRAAQVGARILWDVAAQVPYYQYWDGRGQRHVVYYENASSMAAKVDLVTRHRLGGSPSGAWAPRTRRPGGA